MRDNEMLNLGKLAYHIEKGDIDTKQVITMKHLLEAGVLPKIKYGVTLLARGAEKFKKLNIPI